MSDRIEAPWTPEQVEALNKFQHAGRFHPFTCPNHGEPPHSWNDILVATANGWICPNCSYTQTWAHEFMTDPKASEPFKWS